MTTKNEKLEQAATDDRQAAIDAEREAELAKLSPEERAAREAQDKASESASKVELAKAEQAAKESEAATPATDVKGISAAVDLELNIGAHHAQTFANVPENPQLAHGLDPAKGADVRLELSDSEHPDPLHPKVTYVHEAMVNDYLRAGWRRPVA